ncbi:unnamed protein product [Camellia sinensis]
MELYSNNISGRIPIELGNLTSLVSLDLYLNNLSGIIPDTLGRLQKLRYLGMDNKSELTNRATRAITGGVVAGATLLFLALAWWWRRKLEDSFFDVPVEEGPEVHLGQLKRFSLRELQVATDNFSSINILGRGGFGKEYKGRLADGSLVAVKRLKEECTQGGELQFQTEVKMVSMAVLRNLLPLCGFCMTLTKQLLIYPFMSNGSVASCLRV